MIPKPMRSFINQLQNATDSDVVQWEDGADESYFCNHKNATLHIANNYNNDSGESSFYFRLIAGSKNTAFVVTELEEDYSIMGDLYSSVMANANKVKEVLETFFDP